MANGKRLYNLFGKSRGGPFTVHTSGYLKGTHRWCYEVYAVSVKQAYYLAGNEVWADDEHTVGGRKIERDWWHDSGSPGWADVDVAPYLAVTDSDFLASRR